MVWEAEEKIYCFILIPDIIMSHMKVKTTYSVEAAYGATKTESLYCHHILSSDSVIFYNEDGSVTQMCFDQWVSGDNLWDAMKRLWFPFKEEWGGELVDGVEIYYEDPWENNMESAAPLSDTVEDNIFADTIKSHADAGKEIVKSIGDAAIENAVKVGVSAVIRWSLISDNDFPEDKWLIVETADKAHHITYFSSRYGKWESNSMFGEEPIWWAEVLSAAESYSVVGNKDLLFADNDIDVVGKCANCGVEFHIHKDFECGQITAKEWSNLRYILRKIGPKEKRK